MTPRHRRPGDGASVGRTPRRHRTVVRLRDVGTWEQMREYFVHRSLYHLKEGDPHSWLIPRLGGQAKASFVAVEYDEYGAGSAARLHQNLFADLMREAALDDRYLGYLDAVPAESLTLVNLMSMFGLHRRLRGAAAGYFAATEIASSPGSQRLSPRAEPGIDIDLCGQCVGPGTPHRSGRNIQRGNLTGPRLWRRLRFRHTGPPPGGPRPHRCVRAHRSAAASRAAAGNTLGANDNGLSGRVAGHLAPSGKHLYSVPIRALGKRACRQHHYSSRHV